MKKLTSEQCARYAKELIVSLYLKNTEDINQLLNQLFETENLHSFLTIKPLVDLIESENTFLQQIVTLYQSQKQHAMLIAFLARLKRSGCKMLAATIDLSKDFLVAGLEKTPDDFLYILENDFIAPAQTVYDAMLKNGDNLPNSMALKEALLYLYRQKVSPQKDSLISPVTYTVSRWIPLLGFHYLLVQGIDTTSLNSFFNRCNIEPYLIDELFEGKPFTFTRSHISTKIMEFRQLIAIDQDYAKRKNGMNYLIDKYIEQIPTYQNLHELPMAVRNYAKKVNNTSSTNVSLAELVRGFYVEGSITKHMSAFFADSISMNKTEAGTLNKSLEIFISDDFRPYAFAAIQKCISADKTLPTLSALILHKELPQNIKNVLCYLTDRLTHPEYKDYLSQIEMTELDENDKTPVLSTAPTLTLFGTAGQVVSSSKAAEEVTAAPQAK